MPMAIRENLMTFGTGLVPSILPFDRMGFVSNSEPAREQPRGVRHHLTNLLTKLTNQVIPSTSTPPPNPSPLPSQPLPNPKGGINLVKKGDKEKEERRARTEWLLELMAKVDGFVGPDDEDWWDESDEEDEEDPEEDEVELERGKEEVIVLVTMHNTQERG
ncbi:hypothetical protein PIB30_088746 [Stylosanthes scabra]|uniref:Uncharacterized protein n=1 Tax=Stylosanthes scabra TaxID=79078 RepID=A0ABU6QT86_9FABA|nr:hypothetical protein [Stylosanthes scabra]